MLRLLPVTDADYAWMLVDGIRTDGVILCEGGIAPAEVVAMLRGVTAALSAADNRPVAWLIAEQDQVIGMINFTQRHPDGRYDLGYGIASAHQGRGVMSRAMGILIGTARNNGHIGLTAETSIDNPASQRVLVSNGFVQTGTRDDPEDGSLITWAIDLTHDAAMDMPA
jgi:RimJ/RimL family protein N-acetyltransferase